MNANPYWDATLPDMLDAAAARFGRREALVYGGLRLTYGELHQQVERLSRGLLALGVAPDEKVAVWLPNRPEWLVLQHACARIGAVLVPLHTSYRIHELDYILRQSDAGILVLQDRDLQVDFLSIVAELLPGVEMTDARALQFARFPALRRIVRLSESPRDGTIRYQDILAAGDEIALREDLHARRAEVEPDRVLTLLYTSGTTAFPKGAMIAHRTCLPHSWAVGGRYRISERDRMLLTLPLSGSWGLLVSVMTCIYGATLVMSGAALPRELLRLLETERITMWHAVDTTLIGVLDHPDLERCDRSALRSGCVAMTGGGRHDLFDDVVTRLGMLGAMQGYGMTEVNSMALSHVPEDPVEVRRRSGGFPTEGLEVRVVDPETRDACPAGRPGELCFRGPFVTCGYYGNPAETAATIDRAGWLHTGDLAVQDETGRTFFLGRLKDTLRIGHMMVAPAEIEAFLMEHPKVEQAFVVGVSDLTLGEVAVAYVIPCRGEFVTERELQDHCRGRLASVKMPRHIWTVDDVPRTRGPHGDKVQRVKLREIALRTLGLEP